MTDLQGGTQGQGGSGGVTGGVPQEILTSLQTHGDVLKVLMEKVSSTPSGSGWVYKEGFYCSIPVSYKD